MKSKLPLGKKKKSDDEEYEEEEIESESNSSHQDDATDSTDISEMDIDEDATESKSLVHKLKSKLNSLRKGKATSDDEEGGEEEDDDEAAKKKKRSKILQIVIGGGLVVFLASDYIFPPEEPAPEIKLKPRPRPKKPVVQEDGTAAPAETPAADTPAETTDTPAEDTPTDTTATTETPATDTPVEETPTDTATVETPTDSGVDVTSTETPVDTPTTDTATDTATETVTDTTIDTNTGDVTTDTPDVTDTDSGLGEPTDMDPGAVMSADTIDGSMPGQEDNLTDQILEDLEKQARTNEPEQRPTQYVAPPDYEYRGRGLVYNCTGKHWACVDAPSYKACEDNSASVKYLNKTTECYPFNVYETAKGCESMQNRMVSSSAKTDFCSE